MPDLFGNAASQLPPWLTNQPTASQFVDKAFQAKQQAFNNFADLSRLNMEQRQQAQRDELAPLLMEAQQQRNILAKQDIAIGAAKVYDEIESSGMTAKVAGLRLLAAKSPNGFADPAISTALDEAAIKWPSIVKSPLWQQTRQDVNVAKQFVQQRDMQKLRNDAPLRAGQYYSSLMQDAQDAFDAGDFEGAKALEDEAKAARDFSMKRGAVGAPGTVGGARPTTAMANTDALVAAKTELEAAQKSGDPEAIRKATFKYNTLATTTKMPGMTDASQRLALSSRTIPERIYSNATLAWDQVNTLLENKGEEGAGPFAAGAALYQKTVGNLLPSDLGETAVSNQSKYAMLRNSLQAMASADRSRSAALIKEVDQMMPPTGVWTSPAAAKTQLSEIKSWVRDRARQAALDVGDLPPYWALTIEDAAHAVDAGEKAVAAGLDPKSDLFKRKYMTIEEASRLFDKETAPRQQPPSNAPIQLPNPPR